MLEIADLFHEKRFGEWNLSVILYFPIGLCLVLIRILAAIVLFGVSLVVPRDSSFFNEALCFILSLNLSEESRAGLESTSSAIFVANRTTIFDIFLLKKILSVRKIDFIDLSKKDFFSNLFKQNPVEKTKTQEELVDFCCEKLKTQSLIFQPEPEITTGQDGLLKFDLSPFTIAKRTKRPILPISLRTSRIFPIRSSVFKGHPLSDVFWFLFNPLTRFHVNYTPLVQIDDETSDQQLAEKVRRSIAEALRVELTEFDEIQIQQLKNQPRLFYERQERRRAEFQEMINFVHQTVPEASIEAIRFDLETTKNVQRTIENLNERVAAAARAAAKKNELANSSRTISKSNSNNHRSNYERLKQEMILKNRQLFLNKNSN